MLNNIIYTALNKSAITALVGKYKTKAAIFSDMLIPQDYSVTAASINFYYSAPYNAALDYSQLTYTINCRAYSMTESQALAQAVKTAINRVSGSDYYISVNVLPTINPADDRDNYNSIVEAIIKKRG